MAICSTTSYLFGFTSRIKRPPLDTLEFIATTLRNKDKTFALIRVDEDGALARSSELMKTCHNMNIIFQTKGRDSYSLNGKNEIPNKTLHNITRYILLKSSHKKELWCFTYHYTIWLSRQNDNILSGDVTYFLWHGTRTLYNTHQNTEHESLHHQ